jgi:hypothetical protein
VKETPDEPSLEMIDGEYQYPQNDKCITNAEIAEEIPEDTRGELKQTWDLFLSVRMLKVVPLMIWSAVSLAIFSAIFIPFFTDSMTGKA